MGNFSFFLLVSAGAEYCELNIESWCPVFPVGWACGLAVGTLGTGRGGPGEVTAPFLIPSAREAGGVGMRGGVQGQVGRISGNPSFCSTSDFTFFFPWREL